MAEFLYRLGQAAARRARLVIAASFAVLIVSGVAFVVGAGTLTSTVSIPGTRTAQVTERLQDVLPDASGGNGTIVFETVDGSPLTDAQQSAISEQAAEASRLEGVATVVDPFRTETERAAQQQEIEEGRARIEDGRRQLDAARAQLEDGQAQLDAAREQAEAAGALDQVAAQLEAQQANLDAGRRKLDEQGAELEAGRDQVEQGARLLELSSEIRMVSEDRSAAIVTVLFDKPQLDVAQDDKDAVIGAFGPSIDGVEVSYSAELATGIPSILGIGEVIGIVVAAVVLVVMLGTLIGAGLPILTALVGVAIGALLTMSLSSAIEMTSVTPVLGLMLGLAVGIDYTLFIVNRHRRQLKEGYDVEESIGLANGTSGNAVVFAGSTVLIALLALNVTGIPFLGLMGTVGALSIAIAVLIAITLTPALLGLIGERILSRRERAALAAAPADPATVTPVAATRGKRLRPMSTWRAVGSIALGIGALVAIALPSLDLRLGLPDGSAEAVDSTQYQAYSTVSEKFGPGRNAPLLVVADIVGVPGATPDVTAQAAIAEEIAGQDDVVAVAPIGVSEGRTVAAFQVVPTGGPNDASTEQLVQSLRELEPMGGTVTLDVAGMASGNIDISDKLSDALPAYLALVVGLSIVILVLVFRSIFVPAIATLGFVLSYFAAMGGVVAIYQWGWLSTIFGVDTPSPILSFLPTMLAGILFGLAMDYMLFLGSGMREAYVHGAPARLAVVQGLRAGRSVVAAAAIIMISVFGGFVFSDSAMIRPIGFGLAFGVLVDAFVVRMLIVPSLMHLAGDKAWWLPKWLDRVLPNLDVEGAALERRHPHVAHPEPESTLSRA
ncbi:MMPL family transporter [Intrasporangium sp.]|uniref:MMPL family transporter n=1 Tax=Intrasporangium sp. TaxID=1925024 RepID=UPI00293A8CFA|nr:MMPL family transporter [Intrasporangium sp.]MDV3220861.1 MMPL family transporter [Intrasporangium sp.]